MTIWLAVISGGLLGFVLARGDFCFHSTWRRVFQDPPRTSLLRAYVVLLLVSTPFVQLFVATGLIEPFIPPLTPWAAIVGGLLFGLGMVIAQTCISGMFYKLGAGMVAMVVALISWAIGDVLVWRGSLSGLRDRLVENEVTVTASDGSAEVATVTSVFGIAGVLLVIVAGLGLAAWAMRDEAIRGPSAQTLAGESPPWSGSQLGVAAGAVMVIAWLLVRWHGFDYAYGTSSIPSQVYGRVVDGVDTAMWLPLALVSVVPGALIAAMVGNTLRFRGEQGQRYVELGVGGVVMGIGAGIAGGCNLGHSMVGVPLLSLGSILTTMAIVAGVFVGHRAASALNL